MFPKRKLDESRSGSESQKEEEVEVERGAEDEEAQRTKRARVESSPDSGGKALSPARHQASAPVVHWLQPAGAAGGGALAGSSAGDPPGSPRGCRGVGSNPARRQVTRCCSCDLQAAAQLQAFSLLRCRFGNVSRRAPSSSSGVPPPPSVSLLGEKTHLLCFSP